jgi:hypothetical protein
MIQKNRALSLALAAAAVIGIAPVADARETIHRFSIEEALNKLKASGQLGEGVKLYFGKQKHAKPKAQLGLARTNKKTSFFKKSDQEACDWAFASSMVALVAYAQKLGGNAIVNIRSNYKGQQFTSETEYTCGAGNITGGTAFIGDVVKLP